MRARRLVLRELPLLVLVALLGTALVSLGAHHVVQMPLTSIRPLDHLGVLCLIALHELLRPVHYGFHALVLVGVVYAVWDRFSAWHHSRHILSLLDSGTEAAPAKIVEAAARARVPLTRIHLVSGLPVPAFTAGWLRPRVYVAAKVVNVLTVEELAGVLAHENHHVRQRDPLRLFAMRFLGALLFWLPVGRTLARVAADNAELAADDAAGIVVGRETLARALLRLAHRFTRPAPAWSAPFHSPHFLERRVQRLIGVASASEVRSSATRGVIVAVNVLLVAALSGTLMAHPLAENRDHCQHQAQSPFAHLMCRLGKSPDDGCAHLAPHAGHTHQH